MKKYINFFEKCSNEFMSVAKNEFQKLHIKRKIEHCKRVNKLSVEIAQKLDLSAEEVYLISISSLFHDIGRFKQFYEYNTYNDSISCNHELLSIEILEQENVLNVKKDIKPFIAFYNTGNIFNINVYKKRMRRLNRRLLNADNLINFVYDNTKSLIFNCKDKKVP